MLHRHTHRRPHAALLLVAQVLILIGVLAVAAQADAGTPTRSSDPAPARTITLDRHAVVTASTLHHCKQEDGRTGPRPCTWNVGPGTDGNGVGLAFWVGKNRRYHYVWATDPTDHGHRRWLTRTERADFRAEHARPWIRCYLSTARARVHCPNGDWYTTT